MSDVRGEAEILEIYIGASKRKSFYKKFPLHRRRTKVFYFSTHSPSYFLSMFKAVSEGLEFEFDFDFECDFS